jgi:hypothetical protein
MSTAANGRAAVERYLAAAEAGDTEAVREFLATALSYYQPGSVSLEVTSIVAEGDEVVVEWTSRARSRAGRPVAFAGSA